MKNKHGSKLILFKTIGHLLNDTSESLINESAEYNAVTSDYRVGRLQGGVTLAQTARGREVELSYSLFGDDVSVMVGIGGLIRI